MYDEESAERLLGNRRRARGRDAAGPAVPATVREAGRAGVRPRRARGPWPVRPGGMPVSVRPAQAERPASSAEPTPRPCPGRQRTLARPPLAPPVGPLRRLLAGLLGVALAAAVVVGLGQLLALGAGPSTAGPAAAGPAGIDPAGIDPAGIGSAGIGSAGIGSVGIGSVGGGRPAAGLVVVGAEPTVWELARRLEPAAGGPRLAELAERIVVDNSLTSVELRPGQLLRVPAD